jgi:hypothetical protein
VELYAQLQEADNWEKPAATTWAAEFLLRDSESREFLCKSGVRTLQKGENMDLKTTDVLPTETVAHIQSAGCKAQKTSVIGAHNRCWKYLIGAISTHGEATRDLEFIGGDKDKQLEKLWAETRIGNILPWDEIADEAERLLESDQANRRVPDDDHVDKEQEELYSDGEDRTLLQSIGPAKFCTS